MNIVFIGTGYVGLVSGACFAELGQDVVCVDKDKRKIESLKKGKIPIYEPGLAELVEKNCKAKRLTFTTSTKQALENAEVVFIAVGTPTNDKDGSADLSYVYAAAEEIANYIKDGVTIVTKSTVPVGTGKKVTEIIHAKRRGLDFSVASNPEFLREGCAVNDFLYPDRVIVGVESDDAKNKMERLYKPLTSKGVNLLITDLATAELTKYAANAFLATKIAFINEVADMCERTGANITDLAKGIGMDHRIGATYLSPGPGYGGSCFPKDTLALQHMSAKWGSGEMIVSSVIASNNERKLNMHKKVVRALGGKVKGKTIAILGLAFKANTDDMRESPALPIIESLLKEGANLKLYDQEAMHKAKDYISGKVQYSKSCYQAIEGADAAAIVTEWAEFSNLDFDKIKSLMKTPIIIDYRNMYNPQRMKERGISYYSVGRKEVRVASLRAVKKVEKK